jgi:hypothetical protein
MESQEQPRSRCACCAALGRRDFLKEVAAVSAVAPVATAALEETLFGAATAAAAPRQKRPAVVKVGFIRHPGKFAGGWPGHGFDNDLACKRYSEKLQALGKELGLVVDLADSYIPVGEPAATDRFIAAVAKGQPDALLLCPIGIFTPWDRARKILDSCRLPTIIFTQIGTSFTSNTTPLTGRPGVYLVSSLEIGDVRPGLEMVKAAQGLKQSRLVVVKGAAERDKVYGDTGIHLQYVPEKAYLDAFRQTPVTAEVRRLAEEAVGQARQIREVAREDIVQAARHYFAAKRLMAHYGGDGITSNCLGLLFGQVGTPCLGYSRLLDEGVVAGCEADVGSASTMLLSHSLLGRPGFMADPLVDTVRNLFANAHCTCATRLGGFAGPREEYVLRAHHAGGHYVSVQALWKIGQVFTLVRFQRPNLMIVDRAKVACNYESPPSAACITNVGSVVEGAEDDPHKVGGFHVLQIYGDHVRRLRAYCQLYGIEAVHAWDPRVSFEFSPDYA